MLPRLRYTGEPPEFAMRPSTLPESEELLADLVHDLRQPLGTIDSSACYLKILLDGAQSAVQEQLRLIQQQVELAARLLAEAAARRPRQRVQGAAAGESLDLTKSHTAAVT